MSRIEEALEKAARLRSTEVSDFVAEKIARAEVQLPLEEKLLGKILEDGARNRSPFEALAPEIRSREAFSPPLEPIKVTDRVLVAASDPHSSVAEEFRKLKSSVVKLTKGEPFKNMLMVTSSLSDEGKSMTALNLAMTLAQDYDHTVLLVDADLRNPSLHSYLGLKPALGLTECLLDGIALKDVLIKTGIGRLSLLPAGRQVLAPAEIFSSDRIKDFFLEIKNRYPERYIIIDTAPVLPFAETRSISTIIDGVILVIKEGAVPAQSVLDTLECLNGSTILGVVYNQSACR